MADSPPPQPAQLYRLPRGRTVALAHGSDCVVALRALGEDTRVRIMGLLIQAPRDVSEIAEYVGVSHYNVSKHLRILRETGREARPPAPLRARRGHRTSSCR